MYIRMHVHSALVSQIFSVACRNAFLCAVLKDALSHFLIRGLGTRVYTLYMYIGYPDIMHMYKALAGGAAEDCMYMYTCTCKQGMLSVCCRWYLFGKHSSRWAQGSLGISTTTAASNDISQPSSYTHAHTCTHIMPLL